MRALKSVLFLFTAVLFIFSCKKQENPSSNFRISSIRVLSLLEDDSFILNYNTAGKISSVWRNGIPYMEITALSDTCLQIVDFTDTSSGTVDTVWCSVENNSIQNFRKRFGALYTYFYNGTGAVDSVMPYPENAFYNYTYFDPEQNRLHYIHRYLTICGFSTVCSKYFRDSIHFEDNTQQLTMPDQFIYQNLSEVTVSKGLPYKYLLGQNGYFVNFNKNKRIKEWTGTFTPIFIPMPEVRYTLKYFYTFTIEGQLSKMRTETYDESGSLVFYKEYYFSYESL